MSLATGHIRLRFFLLILAISTGLMSTLSVAMGVRALRTGVLESPPAPGPYPRARPLR